jgi:hypothetical protein
MIGNLSTFTAIHTVLSLAALASGIVVVIGLLAGRMHGVWTTVYLVTAVAASVTGFGFPFTQFMASHWVGVISLVVLAAALLARYGFHLAGAWRWVYAVGIVISVYFLVFVTIAQAFQKVTALKALAPTMSEAPFAVAQLVVLAIFVWLAIAAARKFRPPAMMMAQH